MDRHNFCLCRVRGHLQLKMSLILRQIQPLLLERDRDNMKIVVVTAAVWWP